MIEEQAKMEIGSEDSLNRAVHGHGRENPGACLEKTFFCSLATNFTQLALSPTVYDPSF
jgi:hypothetical protein